MGSSCDGNITIKTSMLSLHLLQLNIKKPPNVQRVIYLLLLFQSLLLLSPLKADLSADSHGLLQLKNAVDLRNVLQWNAAKNVCDWKGIQCRGPTTGLRVTSVRLPGVGLNGVIPVGSLGSLNYLRVLSLRSNKLSGPLPLDLANCSFLKSIYLQYNSFSGPLPSNFNYWPHLVHLDFSSNSFNGTVPASLATLTKLKSLFLQNNSLSGQIPPLNATSLSMLSVAYNRLSGVIPNTPTLRGFSQASYVGNRLCGFPLSPCSPSPSPSPSPMVSTMIPHSHGKSNPKPNTRLSTVAIIGLVIGSCAAAIMLFVIANLLAQKESKLDENDMIQPGIGEPIHETQTKAANQAHYASAPSSSQSKELVFFERDQTKYSFQLDDLLKASAEVLGKGSIGTTYKAVLECGTILAVNRLRAIDMELEAFERRIGTIASLKHENLVPLIAYYFSKQEKLLVYEFMMNGSLSALLHGSGGAGGLTILSWQKRVEIAMEVARGLEYLHSQEFIHGNIKASNILLTSSYKACISDYGLAQLASSAAKTPKTTKRVMGYQAPELNNKRIQTADKKTDAYSYGVLVMELLTGKAPSSEASSLGDGEGQVQDLPLWVRTRVGEEGEGGMDEVLDREMMMRGSGWKEGEEEEEKEMVKKLLHLALACVAPSPDQRPSMQEILHHIQGLLPTSTCDNPKQ